MWKIVYLSYLASTPVATHQHFVAATQECSLLMLVKSMGIKLYFNSFSGLAGCFENSCKLKIYQM